MKKLYSEVFTPVSKKSSALQKSSKLFDSNLYLDLIYFLYQIEQTVCLEIESSKNC